MKPKFIHTSDIHLGVKFNIKQFSLKEREKRREELWDTFEEIIRIAKEEKVSYLFIAGDLTEGDYLKFKYLKKIIQQFNAISDTKVIITCGSNDAFNINSIYDYIEWPNNVYIFRNTDSIQKLTFSEDNLCIYSLSWDNPDSNLNSQLIYDISVDDKYINVLLLHGDIDIESEMLPINKDLIKNKFDYCALGSKHNYLKVLDNIVYSGSPEPLSFDEPEDHGIVLGSLEKHNIEYQFFPIAKRKFVTRHIELNITYSFNKILDLIKFSGDTFSNIKDYVKVVLTGTVNTDISMEEIKNEAKQFFYYIEFEENYIFKSFQEKRYDGNDYNIIESYKLQFENHQEKLEQQAYQLGIEVLRKEKVVK